MLIRRGSSFLLINKKTSEKSGVFLCEKAKELDNP